MAILLFFAFISGIITIAAPCIWPLLPIILSSSATGGRAKPLGITFGIMTSFALFTLTLSYIVKIIPFDPNILRLFAVVVIGFLGLTLVVPALNQMVEGWVSRLSGRFAPFNKNQGEGLWGGLITGFSLGLVWSPCAGPILATIATLTATQAVNFEVVLVTLVYVAGVGVPLFIFATVGNRFFTQSRILNKYTRRIQQIFGILMILTAVAIFTNFDKTLQARLLDAFPSYSDFVTKFESNTAVKKQLDELKKNKNISTKNSESKPMPVGGNILPNLGPAPDFVGINKWLNSDRPLHIVDLKGKVVLVDFWTYTCINCIRTLPHVTSWYGKYKDKGFVVVGVHTPEFEFEKKTENVAEAIKRFNIHYPVAQDNDYATWNAYNNQYWPAEYLIDAKGNVRRTHFGEGEYDETEEKIQQLLSEGGVEVAVGINNLPDQTPRLRVSPETYLGLKRRERFTTEQKSIPLNYFTLSGKWDVEDEFAKAAKNTTLQFHFIAQHVYLVMHPAQAGDKVKVYLDGKLINDSAAGKDVKNSEVTLDMERLYDLVDLQGKTEDHILKLEFENDGTACFAFTFG